MAAKQPTILATSGGYVEGRRTRLEFGPLFHHAVELAGVDGRAPKVTFVGTASGDPRSWAAEIDDAARIVGFDLTHLHLFPMPNLDDIEGHLLAQDVIWVNGGSVANLLAVWDVHALRPVFRRVWEGGVVLAGVSAGSICWYLGGVSLALRCGRANPLIISRPLSHPPQPGPRRRRGRPAHPRPT